MVFKKSVLPIAAFIFFGGVFLIVDVVFWFILIGNADANPLNFSNCFIACIPLLVVVIDIAVMIRYIFIAKKALIVEKDKIILTGARRAVVSIKDIETVNFINYFQRTGVLHPKTNNFKSGTMFIRLKNGETITMKDMKDAEEATKAIKASMDRYKEFEAF